MATVIPSFYRPRADPSRKKWSDAKKQLMLEVKRAQIRSKLHHVLIDIPTLWELVLQHSVREENGQSDAVQIRIDYNGYRQIGRKLVKDKAVSLLQNPEKELTDGEVEFLYFNHPYLSPKSFLGFESRPEDGTVDAAHLFSYMAKKILLYDLRGRLELAASAGPQQLSPSDVEQFISSLIPHLKVVRDMPEWLIPYYLWHSAQRFIFTLDPQNVGYVSVDRLMTSDSFVALLSMYEHSAEDAFICFPVGCLVEIVAPGGESLSEDEGAEIPMVEGIITGFDGDGRKSTDMYSIELKPVEQSTNPDEPVAVVRAPRASVFWCHGSNEMVQGEVSRECQVNWFSMNIMSTVYRQFITLDKDHDGLLSVDEMKEYNDSSFVPLAIERVFEEHVRGYQNQKMDYGKFVEFVLATEHPNLKVSMKYLWRVLDMHETHTYLSVDTLRFFCRQVSERLISTGLMNVSADSILSEVLDMINPAEDDRVTMEDLIHSEQYGTILPILLDYRSFFVYDQREQLAADAANMQEIDALSPPKQ